MKLYWEALKTTFRNKFFTLFLAAFFIGFVFDWIYDTDRDNPVIAGCTLLLIIGVVLLGSSYKKNELR